VEPKEFLFAGGIVAKEFSTCRGGIRRQCLILNQHKHNIMHQQHAAHTPLLFYRQKHIDISINAFTYWNLSNSSTSITSLC